MASKYAHLATPVKEWEDVSHHNNYEPTVCIYKALTPIFQFYAEYHHVIPVLTGSTEHMRNTMAELKKASAGTQATVAEGLDVHDEQMPTSDNSNIALRIYTPRNLSGPSPAVI